jgi:protein SCO1
MPADLTLHPKAKPTRKWQLSFPVIMFSILGLLAAALFAFVSIRPIQVLPQITLGPGYSLTNAVGETVTHEDMRGSLVLYNFTYLNCQPPCPDTNQVMQNIQARLNEIDTGDIPVHLVTISFDPTRDTPAALYAAAEQLGADPAVWSFLTGTPERLKWVIGGGFGVYYEEREPGLFKFDPAFMLVDGAGILRAEYRTGAPDIDRILRDIHLVAEEVHNRQGVANYAYDAAHLFLCYPR